MPCIDRAAHDHRLHVHRSSGMLTLMHAQALVLMLPLFATTFIRRMSSIRMIARRNFVMC